MMTPQQKLEAISVLGNVTISPLDQSDLCSCWKNDELFQAKLYLKTDTLQTFELLENLLKLLQEVDDGRVSCDKI